MCEEIIKEIESAKKIGKSERRKKEYPKLKFIITRDDLYATSPMLDICKDND